MKPKNTLAISISTVSAFCKYECPAAKSISCRGDQCPFPHSPVSMKRKVWNVIIQDPDPDLPTFFSAVREG